MPQTGSSQFTVAVHRFSASERVWVFFMFDESGLRRQGRFTYCALRLFLSAILNFSCVLKWSFSRNVADSRHMSICMDILLCVCAYDKPAVEIEWSELSMPDKYNLKQLLFACSFSVLVRLLRWANAVLSFKHISLSVHPYHLEFYLSFAKTRNALRLTQRWHELIRRLHIL